MSTSKCFCSFDFQKLVLGDQESVGRSDTDIIEWPAGVPVGSKTGGGSDTRYYSYHTRYQIHYFNKSYYLEFISLVLDFPSLYSTLGPVFSKYLIYSYKTSLHSFIHFIEIVTILGGHSSNAMFLEVTSLQKEEIQKPFLQENKQQFFTYE